MHNHLRIGRRLASTIGWLRAGYPVEAPQHGYSPLLALAGPPALTGRQTSAIVAELGDRPTDAITIAVAITKAADRLPTAAETRAIASALHRVRTHPHPNRRRSL
jgi:hypothetical protein